MVKVFLLLCAFSSFFLCNALAGPYAPAAGQGGSQAISLNDKGIAGWVTGVEEYTAGAGVTDQWKNTMATLGSAEGDIFSVVSLGRGGSIVLRFNSPIKNHGGWDFAVFENSFSDTALELAFVEVSSDGANFVRFPNHSLTENRVHAFGHVDTTNIDGFAGKYRAGFGTPFDLQDLEDAALVTATLDLDNIGYIRLIDVVGDGSTRDTRGNPVYAPYPTSGSAGFDLDGVAVLSGVLPEPEDPNPGQEDPLVSGGLGSDSGCFIGSLF